MNKIHHSAFIGPSVELGFGNIIGPGANLFGPLLIGNNNWIGPNASIGTPAEVRGGLHESIWDEAQKVDGIEIGDNNVLREFVTVQQPHYKKTLIGSNCFIMTKAHIPHDGIIENDVTISCSVLIGGHSLVQSGSNLGLGSILHPFTVIGSHAMVGMGSVVTKNIPPYSMAYGVPARIHGTNHRKLFRNQFTQEIIDDYSLYLSVNGHEVDEFLKSTEINNLISDWKLGIERIANYQN